VGLVGAAGLVIFSLYGLLSAYLTPYKENTRVQSEFYLSRQSPQATDVRARVVDISNSTVTVLIEDGAQKGQQVEVGDGGQTLNMEERVLLRVGSNGQLSEYISAPWRIPGLILLGALFVLAVLLVSGRKGLASLAGLTISVGVIIGGLIPALLAGVNAFTACIVAAFVIATFAITTAHGFKKRTLVSLGSIYVVLICTAVLALIGEHLGRLTGIYDETSTLLQVHNSVIDVRGLLIGGIIIATLGVLDDVVTTQTAAIDELHKANPRLSFWQLVRRGYAVGTEHVIALVNTLALAYVGVSLPMVLSITLSSQSQSLLSILNSEFIAQEVVRTLVSSIALVLAVPLSTVVAAVCIARPSRLFAILAVVNKTKRRKKTDD
jgi:uncharacterized membrane protein